MKKNFRIILLIILFLTILPSMSGSVNAASQAATSTDGYYIGILSDGEIAWFNCFGWQPNAGQSCNYAVNNSGGGTCKSCNLGDWIESYIDIKQILGTFKFKLFIVE